MTKYQTDRTDKYTKAHYGSHYLIERECPRTGYTEQSKYEGLLKDKPKGWRVKAHLGTI